MYGVFGFEPKWSLSMSQTGVSRSRLISPVSSTERLPSIASAALKPLAIAATWKSTESEFQ